MPAPVNGDPNRINLSEYKGAIRPCEYCQPEQMLLGRSCQWCLAQGYLSTCLACRGSGKVTSPSVWDGGRSSYTSTCTPCGGKGVYPARKADYDRQQQAQPAQTSQHRLPPHDDFRALRSLPEPVRAMTQLDIGRPRKS